MAGIETTSRRLNYLLSETDAVYHELAAALGLSDSVMMILYALLDAGGSCSLQALSRGTGCCKQTVNSALRRLEAEGLVQLEAADGKRKRVFLTARGRACAGQTVGRIIAMENEIYASWPEEDMERYLALTERYLRALREKAKALEEGRI